MKLVCAAVAACGLAAAAWWAVEDAPASAVTLALPGSAHALRLEYRQVEGERPEYRETSGLDAAGLKALQVQSLLSQGGRLQTDIWLRLGDHALGPGVHPLGFTLGEHGGVHLFVVDGLEAVALESRPLEPGWSSPRLLLQWLYVDRGEARLLWHYGKGAGDVRVGLGTENSAEAPPERKPAPGGDAADDR